MLKWTARILLGLAIVLVVAFVLLRQPDTDPVEMRAKYGGPPSQFVELEPGYTVHLRDEGPRHALPIVLLHGSNADLHTWQPWVDRLARDYRVIRFDQRGHGLTGTPPDGDYSREAFADDVGRIADRLGLDRFVLGGNSMGGGISARYAIEHPERLAGLLLIDAAGAPVANDGSGNIGFTLARMPVIGDLAMQVLPRAAVEKSLSQSVANQAIVTPQAVDRYFELGRYPGNRAATLERFANLPTPFTAAQVAAIDVPTLVIWGADDALIPEKAGGWYAQTLPDATLLNLPDIGHLPMEEAPEATATALRQWLQTRVAQQVMDSAPAPVDRARTAR